MSSLASSGDCWRDRLSKVNHVGQLRPSAVDLFSGVGGMSLGFERAGFDVVLAIDHDPIHVGTYSRNFPSSHVMNADLGEIHGDEILSRTMSCWERR